MSDVEVDISNEGGRAVIEDKTSVPFRTFVSLILQRKVQTIFKKCQDEPVIVSSELLTSLASAPDDRQEDRAKLVLVTMGVGVIVGLFVTVAIFVALMLFGIQPEMQDLLITLAALAFVAVVIVILQGAQKKKGFKDKLYESMEKVTDLVTR
ncbi:hypothetical protein EXS65_02605 [Candidatus Peribacteria bacterium]|nr:hypothetical protein [Candidatus Peribacteria bacterium]